MNEPGAIWAIVGGVACGLSGALLGVACSRRGRSGPLPSWVRPALLAAAVLGVFAAVAGIAASVAGRPGVPLGVITGGATLAVLSILFHQRPRPTPPTDGPGVSGHAEPSAAQDRGGQS